MQSCLLALSLALTALASPGWGQDSSAEPLLIVEGTGLSGGAKQKYGSTFLGKTNVNFVYAQPSGALSQMSCIWTMEKIPETPLFLHLTAADDDGPEACSIRIQLNGQTLFTGKSPFPNGRWETREYPIPAAMLKKGENRLEFSNLEPVGQPGGRPWFMVTEAVIGPKNFRRPVPPIRLLRSPGAKLRQIGLAKVDITPRHPVLLSGYAARSHQLTSNVGQKLWARGLAIGSDEESPAILIAVDNTGVPAAVRAAVLEELQSKYKIRPDRFTIASTHTHSGPMLKGVLENLTLQPLTPEQRDAVDGYTQELVDHLVEVAVAALKDRQPGSLHQGQGETRFAINRRRGPGIDPATPVLVITDEAGSPRGVMTSYACHCVSGGYGLDIHGDWAGCAAEEIEKLVPGAMSIVLVGCGGDQNPAERLDLTVSRRQGALLAAEVRRVMSLGLFSVEGDLVTTAAEIQLPFAELPSREVLEKRAGEAGIVGLQARQTLARLQEGKKIPASLTYPIQTWKFANQLAMVFLGDEVVVDYSLMLKQLIDPARLWVTSYSNDVACYIPTDRILKEGGYEPDSSMGWYGQAGPLAAGAERLILAEVQRQIGDLSAWKHQSARTGGTLPLSPAESLTRFQVSPGFHVEVAAAEPLVIDPVAIDFGPDGKLWVAEMRDYPEGNPEVETPGGVVKFLIDEDRDGRYDRATVFLEGLSFPTGVTAWRKGVLVCVAPDVIYAEDTDGDGRADLKEVVLSGFATHNYQARVNSLSLGLDNWMYGAAGIFGGEIHAPGHPVVDARNRDFRFLPDRKIVQGLAGRTQQGRARDDWGDWFGCSNSVLLQSYPVVEHYYARNPRISVPRPDVMAATDSKLYPAGELVRFKASGASGTPTSACGLGLYRDAAWGEEYSNNTFTCEPVNQLVHRRQLASRGSTMIGVRPESEKMSEFLTSSDNWFRPVQVRTGPDGALWVVDMYRYVIEHPKFISEEAKSKLDLRAGDDRGRIYRIVRDGMKPETSPDLRSAVTADVIASLASPNGTVRDLAHLELLWRNETEHQGALEQLARECPLPQGRLQALCVLDGLQLLQESLLAARLEVEQHPGVQRHLIRLSEKFLPASPHLIQQVSRFVSNPDPQVRLQLAYSLGEAHSPLVSEPLGELLIAAKDDLYLRGAVFSSLNASNIEEMLTKLRRASLIPELLNSVVLVAAEVGAAEDMNRMLAPEFDFTGKIDPVKRFRLLGSLHQILSRRHLADAGEFSGRWEKVSRQALETLESDAASADLRAAAVPLAVLNSDADQVTGLLQEFLAPSQPAILQKAAIEALPTLAQGRGTEILLDAMRSLSPALQLLAVDRMLSERRSALLLLDRFEAGSVSRSVLDLTRQQELKANPDAEIRERTKKLFVETSSDEVARQLAELHGMDLRGGNRDKGREIFVTHCAACHQLHGVGQAVGPDLAALTDKSKDYLLKSILNPNAAVDRRYASYTALLTDGRVFSGILTSEGENSIILKEKGGAQRELLRVDLEELADTGKSLMPEGFGREISPAAIKDLLMFLDATQPGS